MYDNVVVRYWKDAVAPQFDGASYLMGQPALAHAVLELIFAGYRDARSELGAVKEAVLAASLVYNRN